jgi:hypothetical protein
MARRERPWASTLIDSDLERFHATRLDGGRVGGMNELSWTEATRSACK